MFPPCRDGVAVGLILSAPTAPGIQAMRLTLSLLLAPFLLLLPVFGLAGVPVPEADARYVERDPAAIAMHAGPGDNARFRRKLNSTIRKDPKNAFALLHRGYLLHASGDIEEGDRDFQRVLALTATDPVNHRRALWSLGWSAYNRGLAKDAVSYWEQAAAAHGGRPSWFPYTVAVGLWTQGEREAALAWYDTAARSQADWARSDGVAARTRHWRAPERQAIEALFEAWSGSMQASAAEPAGG